MSATAGAAPLTRFALRRSRLLGGVWVAAFAGIAAVSSTATVGLYPSEPSRLEAAAALNGSRALVALYGRVYDPTSLGAIAMIKMGGFGAVFVALFSIVLMVRHTRADEEAGRAELVSATAVGRLAPLAAALTTVVLVDLALGVLTAVALTATGLPADGSFAFGAAWAGVGIAFAAVAAVAAQLTSSARTALSASAGVVAATYLLRAAGDAASEGGARWLTWLSPIGWGQQFRPYAGNRWWVLLVTLGFSAAAVTLAFVLAARRDLGTGLFPPRPGPARAPAGLRTSFALAWRLHRVSLLAWSAAFAFFGLLMGALASTVGDFLSSDQARDFVTKLGGEQAITDAYLAMTIGMGGIVAAAYGISVVVRLRSEEAAGQADPVLATAVDRLRWATGYAVIAFGGTALLLVVAGTGAGVAHALALHDVAQIGRMVGAALAQLPAAWVLVGLAVLLFGVAPRFTSLAWAAFVAVVLLGEVGPLLDLSHWLMDLSPFGHSPRLPGGSLDGLALAALVAVAVGFGAVGFAALRRRDVG